jgi:hypothetical protein
MTISKMLGWISFVAALTGAAWIVFTIAGWTMTDASFDPYVGALTFFFGPLLWIVVGTAATYTASKIFKWAGE